MALSLKSVKAAKYLSKENNSDKTNDDHLPEKSIEGLPTEENPSRSEKKIRPWERNLMPTPTIRTDAAKRAVEKANNFVLQRKPIRPSLPRFEKSSKGTAQGVGSIINFFKEILDL